MTTLHDRLTELAEDVPVAPPPHDLWDEGMRRHRRERVRRIGTATIVVVCCLLLAGFGWLDWRTSRTAIDPASGEDQVGIPDRFHEPSKWLPGTDGEPFGPLIATMGAERGDWFGSHWAVVGTSATTGEYRFLDLPGRAASEPETALSPDGRYVAYWLGGRPPVQRAPEDWLYFENPAVGYAVYDVTTAETVLSVDVQSSEGLMASSLAWADNDTVGVSFSRLQWTDENTGFVGVDGETRLHDVTATLPTGQLEWVDLPQAWERSAGSGWMLEWSLPSRLRQIGNGGRVVRLSGESGVPPIADPSGTRVAGILTTNPGLAAGAGPGGTPNPISVAELGDSDAARFEQIPSDTLYYRLLGWRDEDTVLAWRWTEDDELGGLDEQGMYAVDIHTGEEELLAILNQEIELAAGLLDARVVSRPDPAQPWSPWSKLGTTVAIVVVGAWVLLVWRRRVRP